MDKNLALNPNRVVSFLGKDPKEFTLDDMITFVEENEIKMINFMYPAQDGRVKTLNFVINSRAYLETILTEGERVDGSSLFPAFVEAGSSDLYVMPRFRTAFIDPFSEIPTLCLLLRQGRRAFRCRSESVADARQSRSPCFDGIGF